MVPTLLPDVQGLLRKQDAPAAATVAELMTRGPVVPPRSSAWSES